jgi:hypothetical protein
MIRHHHLQLMSKVEAIDIAMENDDLPLGKTSVSADVIEANDASPPSSLDSLQ